EFSNDPLRLQSRRVDVMEACEWLKPRLSAADAVFFTDEHMIIPHDNILVGLDYSPAEWFTGVREYDTGRAPYWRRHVCTRFGKFRIMYHPDESAKEFDALATSGKHEHVILFVRPDESWLARGHRPVKVIGTDRMVWLLVYEFDL